MKANPGLPFGGPGFLLLPPNPADTKDASARPIISFSGGGGTYEHLKSKQGKFSAQTDVRFRSLPA